MDWTQAVNLFKQTPQAGGSEQAGWNLLQDYGNVAIIQNGITGRYAIIAPDGAKISEPSNYDIRDDKKINEMVNSAARFVGQNYAKDSAGNIVPAIIAPNGTVYPSTDYKGQGATTSPTPPPTPPPTQVPPTQAATTPTPPAIGLPKGYTVTGQEPSGWATGPSGNFIKIADIPAGTGTTTQPQNGTGSTITGDPAGQRAALQAAGIDPTVLSDSQVSALYMMQAYSDAQARADKKIAPASLTAADMDKFLADAKSQFGPYYAEQFDIAKNNLVAATATLTGDLAYQDQQNQVAFQQQQEQAASQAAEAGLARSGVRELAEQRLAQQQSGMVESGRRKAKSDIYQLGSTFEQTYGAGKLAQAGTPSVQMGGYSGLGIAPTTIGYNPTGIKLGTMGAAQATAERQEQARLAQLEASKRLNNAYGNYATNLP